MRWKSWGGNLGGDEIVDGICLFSFFFSLGALEEYLHLQARGGGRFCNAQRECVRERGRERERFDLAAMQCAKRTSSKVK